MQSGKPANSKGSIVSITMQNIEEGNRRKTTARKKIIRRKVICWLCALSFSESHFLFSDMIFARMPAEFQLQCLCMGSII